MQDQDYSDPSEKARGKARQRDRETEDSEDLEDSRDFKDIEEKEESPGGDLPLSLRLPLKRFVEEAARLSAESAESSHESSGRWQSVTWEFTRLLKLRPELSGLSAKRAFEKIPWAVTEFDEDEMLSFLCEWEAVRLLPGQDPVEQALALARGKPIARDPGFKTFPLFISLAGWLQVLVGTDCPIFLPARKIAALLGTTKETVSNMCRLAERDGILRKVERHTPHRAARYSFNIDKFPILKERH